MSTCHVSANEINKKWDDVTKKGKDQQTFKASIFIEYNKYIREICFRTVNVSQIKGWNENQWLGPKKVILLTIISKLKVNITTCKSFGGKEFKTDEIEFNNGIINVIKEMLLSHRKIVSN